MKASMIKILMGLVVVTVVWFGATASNAGVPEPGLEMYGVIRNNLGGAHVRMTSGTLTWTVTSSSGVPVTVQADLKNINDQFSYLIQIPFETPLQGFLPDPNALKLTAQPTIYNREQVRIDGALATIKSPATTTFNFSELDRGKMVRVDLEVAVSLPDSDGDGLPDAWEVIHFGSHAGLPNADDDGDGVTNIDEFKAGTDPNDPESLFQFIEVELVLVQGVAGAQGRMIRWSSMPDRTYAVLRSSNLMSGFVPIVTGIDTTPPANSYTDETVIGAGPYFYTIMLE
ncbi:MAG: hypothetical protein GKR87_09900 [Kiritimatiellae bacterium]|nr:hypothetical protein [Kiritimatiellia bacterium]